jgi:hypothetical protein
MPFFWFCVSTKQSPPFGAAPSSNNRCTPPEPLETNGESESRAPGRLREKLSTKVLPCAASRKYSPDCVVESQTERPLSAVLPM